MNVFDTTILHAVNQLARRSPAVDYLALFFSDDTFIKGGLMTAILWGLWFRSGTDKRRDREFVVGGVLIAIAALFAARALAILLPFRERPLRMPELGFVVPYGVNPLKLASWSSFPSDHAVLFFCLATTVLFLSRAGLLAFCHALFVVAFPRLYLGLHYPTDILAGAAVGIGFACLLLVDRWRSVLSGWALRWLDRSPRVFYSGFYLASFLMATTFAAPREIAVILWDAVRPYLIGP